MKTAFIIFPNNLFKNTLPFRECDHIFLIEEWLFFRLYKFHKQKLVFHRASMKAYERYDKWDAAKQEKVLQRAEAFLSALDQQNRGMND